MDKITIREAATADVPAIVELWKEAMDFHAARDPYMQRSEDGHVSFAEFVTEQISEESSLVAVADTGGEIVAYCLARVNQRPPVVRDRILGHLSDLAVTERWRRRGIGRRMVAEVKDWFKSRKIRRMELRANVANEVSTRFWRKMGLEPFVNILYTDLV